MSLPAVDSLMALDARLSRLVHLLTCPVVLGLYREVPVTEQVLGDPLALLASVLPAPPAAASEVTPEGVAAATAGSGVGPGPGRTEHPRRRLSVERDSVTSRVTDRHTHEDVSRPPRSSAPPQGSRPGSRRPPGALPERTVVREVPLETVPAAVDSPREAPPPQSGDHPAARHLQPEAEAAAGTVSAGDNPIDRPVDGGRVPASHGAPTGGGEQEEGDGGADAAPYLGGVLRVSSDVGRAATVLRAHLGAPGRTGPVGAEGVPAPTRPEASPAEKPESTDPGVPGGWTPDPGIVDTDGATAAEMDRLYDALTDRLRLDVLRVYGTTGG